MSIEEIKQTDFAKSLDEQVEEVFQVSEDYRQEFLDDMDEEEFRNELLIAERRAKNEMQSLIDEEQRISNLRADCIERWTNTCAQQSQEIDRLKSALERISSSERFCGSASLRRIASEALLRAEKE